MCPRRPLSDIKVIFGDGIFDDAFCEGTDITASVLGDTFHLLISKTSVWRQAFGSSFGKIEHCLKRMIHSYSEQQYNAAFDEAKTILAGNVDHLECIQKINEKKHMFAKYLIKKIPGNLGRQGSAPAECNHSSYVARIGPRSIENVADGIAKMLGRQKELELELDLKIGQYAAQCRGKVASMEMDISHDQQMDSSYTYRVKFNALTKLSPWGYELLEMFVNQSQFYTCVLSELGHVLERLGGNYPPRLIKFGERCDCDDMKTYLSVQCKHELARDKCFRLELFDIFWHQVSAVGQSFNVGNSVCPNDENPPHTNGYSSEEHVSTSSKKSAANKATIPNDESDLLSDGDSFNDLCDPKVPAKNAAKHKVNFKVLKSLSNEIIEAVACKKELTEPVAGVLSFVLDAIKNDDLENATKEDCLRRYLSQFKSDKANDGNMFGGPTHPVTRTVAKQAGNVSQRMKSSAEINHRKCRTKHNSPSPKKSQDSPSSSPVSIGRNKRSCKFCRSTDHTSWTRCVSEGKASQLNATVVQGSFASYRSFIDQINHPNYFIVQTSLTSDGQVLDKIPSQCRHIVVNAIYQVPLPDGSTSSMSHFDVQDPRRRVVQLQLLDKNANYIADYDNQSFDIKALVDWIIVSASFRAITKRLFHRLKTIQI